MDKKQLEQIKKDIREYIQNVSGEVFPNKLKDRVSIFLSGSTGWGIKEGFDQKADWDLHLILSDEDYKKFSEVYGDDHVIDDHEHVPNIFGQIRSKQWLKDRLSKIEQGDCLYTWIYNNCLNIQDPQNIQEMIDEYSDLFKNNIEELAKYHFVTYAVRRIDAVSAAKRGIEIGARISNTEMVKAALQTMSIVHDSPYAYNKWLGKQVGMLGEKAQECVTLSEACLRSQTLEDIIKNAKPLRALVKSELVEKFGELPWIEEWWKYNKNPPEVKLVHSKEYEEKKNNPETLLTTNNKIEENER